MRGRRLHRAWFYLRSFFRRRWTLDDYPIRVQRQEPLTDELQPYFATIDGMMLAGTGETPDAARAELTKQFQRYRATHDALPRPGTQVPIQFANSTRVDAHGALRDEFVERILRLEWAFMSDESTLSAFPDGNEEYGRRLILLYGVDLEQLADDRITTILDALADRPARGGRV